MNPDLHRRRRDGGGGANRVEELRPRLEQRSRARHHIGRHVKRLRPQRRLEVIEGTPGKREGSTDRGSEILAAQGLRRKARVGRFGAERQVQVGGATADRGRDLQVVAHQFTDRRGRSGVGRGRGEDRRRKIASRGLVE